MECTISHLITGPAGVTGAFGYWRADGRPVLFPAKAVVLATGGIGKAYEITSNSWEYTGDGHALAYRAGAELIDMEFVQFHPTGMVWPPGVRGLLVTEAVRGEGGILRNKVGERFMWKYLPEDRRTSTPPRTRRPSSWVEPRRRAARPTRAGRRSCPPATTSRGRSTPRSARAAARPTAASTWTSATCRPTTCAASCRRCTTSSRSWRTSTSRRVRWRSGPTTHYVMGGVRVDAETGATTVPGLFAAGEVAGGMHGANRLGGNSLSDLLVFGPRTGAGAAAYAARPRDAAARRPDAGAGGRAGAGRTARARAGRGPVRLQRDLQDDDAALVGHLPGRGRPREALDRLGRSARRATRLRCPGRAPSTPAGIWCSSCAT